MAHIAFNIKNTTKAKVSKSFLKRIAKQVLKILGIKKDVEVGLCLVDEKKMKVLNRQYRGQDHVTDVLAFSQIEFKKHFITPKIPALSLGDVVICYPQAKRQAKRLKHSVLTEIAILFVHGLLHLLGIDHELGHKEARKMMRLEKRILQKFSL